MQNLDLEVAWAKVNFPTLIKSGEYDWIMSQDDYERMAALVNANSPGAATLVQWPHASHKLEQYASRQAAFNEEGGTFDNAVIDLVVGGCGKKLRSARAEYCVCGRGRCTAIARESLVGLAAPSSSTDYYSILPASGAAACAGLECTSVTDCTALRNASGPCICENASLVPPLPVTTMSP